MTFSIGISAASLLFRSGAVTVELLFLVLAVALTAAAAAAQVREVELKLLPAVGALDDAGGRELPGGRTSLVASLARYLSLRDCHVDTS